jgi:hypothetical protein
VKEAGNGGCDGRHDPSVLAMRTERRAPQSPAQVRGPSCVKKKDEAEWRSGTLEKTVGAQGRPRSDRLTRCASCDISNVILPPTHLPTHQFRTRTTAPIRPRPSLPPRVRNVARPTSPFDPNVWSGRASQEVFVELAVSGPASMYPAFDWSVVLRATMDISAPAISLADRPQRAIRVTSVRMPRKDRSSISSRPLADLGG